MKYKEFEAAMDDIKSILGADPRAGLACLMDKYPACFEAYNQAEHAHFVACTEGMKRPGVDDLTVSLNAREIVLHAWRYTPTGQNWDTIKMILNDMRSLEGHQAGPAIEWIMETP